MSVTVILDLVVKPEEVDTLISTCQEILPDTRAYDGNIAIELYRNQDDPNNLTLLEQWETRGHHEKYIAWRTETGVMDKLGATLAAPPSFRYVDHIET